MEKKTHEPVKKQATLFQFRFNKKKTNSEDETLEEKQDQEKCYCKYCGSFFAHEGGRKMHEHWCKEKPMIVSSTTIVSALWDNILKNVCENSSEPGGWRMASKPKPSEFFKNFENKTNSEKDAKQQKDPENTSVSNELSSEDQNEISGPPEKKSRKSYSFVQKAEFMDLYFKETADDPNLTMSLFAKDKEVDKGMFSKWLKEKDVIFQKAANVKICYLTKGRSSNKHRKTYAELYNEFVKKRNKGHKLSFKWIFITGKKISKRLSAPTFTQSAAKSFEKFYNIKVRRVQRKKQEKKEAFSEKLKEWHLNFRETLIKSHSLDPNYDKKWGRFKPHQRFNVDQVPLPFVIDKKTTLERPLSRNEKVWVSNPGSGLEKRQCTLQIAFSAENNTIRVDIIFRGTGKQIKASEKSAYHKAVDIYWQKNAWADTEMSCEWVSKTLKQAVPKNEEFLLICDNLTSQVKEEFKKAVRSINGVVWYGLPGATDIWQPVDAGYGYLLKKFVGDAQDEWLEIEENIDLWMGNNEKKLTVSDRRILITNWVGQAYERLQHPDYDNFRRRCFEKTGCLLTADGSDDDKVKPEGLIGYKVNPSLPFNGPLEYPDVMNPEAAQDPPDIIRDDDLFTSQFDEESLDELSSDDDEEQERIDNDTDRSYNDELVGKKLKILYDSGWHLGTIEYFNTKLNEYHVLFEDEGDEDYIKKDDIDGLEVELIDDVDVSIHGRTRKKNNYKKMANI